MEPQTKALLKHIQQSLYKMAFLDIKRASEGGSKMGAFILASCFIDYLAGYRYGKHAKRKDYKLFVKEYFNDQYDPDKLYHDLRCGLVHNYSVGKAYLFVDNKPDHHMKKSLGEKRFLNLENFINDVENAYNEFIIDIEQNNEIAQLAQERDKLGILGLVYSPIVPE